MSRNIRNITACKKCRQRRVKCDKQFPKCGNCLRKGDECVSVDPGTGEVIGRSYVYELEKQVEQLKAEIKELKRNGGERNGSIEENPVEMAYQSNTSKQNGSTNDNSISYKVLMMKDSDITRLKQSQTSELPKISFVEECIVFYFQVSNPQLPILNREYFLEHYFKPLYGEVSPGLRAQLTDSSLNKSFVSRPSPGHVNEPHKCLFFIHIIIAILSSILQQKYSLSVSSYHQQQSLKYAEYIWNEMYEEENETNKLEIIQSLLLLSTYSIMRPSNPGAWYLIGNSVRLMYDLNLHEDPELVTSDPYLQDMKRRIFWSCYTLDRQVSIYFQKPNAINDDHRVQFPSVFDDLLIYHREPTSPSVLPDNNKLITHHYIKLRILQSQVHDLPADLTIREPFERRLYDWYKGATTLTADDFNTAIMEFNYHYSLALLYKFLLFKPNPEKLTNIKLDAKYYTKYETIFKSCEKVVVIYDFLQNDLHLLNYSWVSINNIFLAGITYLFVIYSYEPIRVSIDLDHLTSITNKVENFLNGLKPVCLQQCEVCINQFTEFKEMVFNLINNERLVNLDIDFDSLMANTDFINSMVGSVNSLDYGN